MTKLFTASLDAARELGIVFEGTADTGSSDTKIVDAALKQAEQTFTGGTLWILSGTYAGTS
jgi:predicted kinase